MLSCDNLSVHVKGRNQPILDKLSAQFAAKKLHAIVGPSGCGKTTLMRAMLQMQSAQGTVSLQGSPIVSQKDVIGAIGLVPQFSVAHEQLRVSECLSYTLRLHRDLSKEKRTQEAEHLLKIVGLSDQINNRVNELSGGVLKHTSASSLKDCMTQCMNTNITMNSSCDYVIMSNTTQHNRCTLFSQVSGQSGQSFDSGATPIFSRSPLYRGW